MSDVNPGEFCVSAPSPFVQSSRRQHTDIEFRIRCSKERCLCAATASVFVRCARHVFVYVVRSAQIWCTH